MIDQPRDSRHTSRGNPYSDGMKRLMAICKRNGSDSSEEINLSSASEGRRRACLICGHSWNIRNEDGREPKRCPLCSTLHWNDDAVKHHVCKRCSHKWMGKRERPLMCPKCRSKLWDQEPIRNASLRKSAIPYDRKGIFDALATMESYKENSRGILELMHEWGMDSRDAEILIRHWKGEGVVGIAIGADVPVERVMSMIGFLRGGLDRKGIGDGAPGDDRRDQHIDNLNEAHIYHVLTFLCDCRPISSARLSEAVDIGHMGMNDIVAVLKGHRLVHGNDRRMVISDAGRRLMEGMPVRLVDLERTGYATGIFQRSVLVKGVADRITNGTQQRDRGRSMGANGASTFVIRDGRLMMPKEWDMDSRDPEFAQTLRDQGIDEGDVVIICGANDGNTAALSAISIAFDLLW